MESRTCGLIRSWALRVAAAITVAFIALSAQVASVSAAEANEPAPVTVQGTVIHTPEGGVMLRVDGKDVPLAARVNWILNTLRDKPMGNRVIRVEGLRLADGTLKINHFWTARDGKLFRVRYFCQVCNIEAFEPGPCVCCQEPVEFQEIPLEKSAK